MKQHHQNLLQIKDFIKEAKIHEERSVLRIGKDEQESTRDGDFLDRGITNWWWGTLSIDQQGLNTSQTFRLPLIRSRPSFPFSLTPYKTELNSRHLKWAEIFPAQSFYIRLHIGPKVSSPFKNPSLPPPPSKTIMPGPRNKKAFGRSIKAPKLHKCTRTTRPLPPNTTLLPNTSIRGHSGQPFGSTTTLITTKEIHKKKLLREITAYYKPVERWFQTLASFDYTTNRAAQLGRTLSQAHTSVPSRQLKNDSKDQPLQTHRQGISLRDTRIKVNDYGHSTLSTAKTAKFFIEDVSVSLHLRTIPEKVEGGTKFDGRPASIASDVEKNVTLNTRGNWQRIEQDPERRAPTSRKPRSIHSKARKRKNHNNLQKRHNERERRQHYRYRIYPERDQAEVKYYRMLRTTEGQKRSRMIAPAHHFKRMNKVTRLTENRRHREQTELLNALLQHSERDDTEDERLMKLIERSDESVRNTAQKDKTFFYHRVKETLLQAESKKKAKRLKLKAELLRKIVEGSSYSDEEASLTKNLIQALHGNKTYEHNVTQNYRHTMKRIVR